VRQSSVRKAPLPGLGASACASKSTAPPLACSSAPSRPEDRLRERWEASLVAYVLLSRQRPPRRLLIYVTFSAPLVPKTLSQSSVCGERRQRKAVVRIADDSFKFTGCVSCTCVPALLLGADLEQSTRDLQTEARSGEAGHRFILRTGHDCPARRRQSYSRL
jgi:hypothetical protein